MYFQHLSTTWTIWNYCAKPNQKAPAPIWGWSQWCLQLVSTTDWWRFWGSVSNHRTMDFFVEPKRWQRELRISDTCSGRIDRRKVCWFRMVSPGKSEVKTCQQKIYITYITIISHFTIFFCLFLGFFPHKSMNWPIHPLRMVPVVPVRRALVSAEPQKCRIPSVAQWSVQKIDGCGWTEIGVAPPEKIHNIPSTSFNYSKSSNIYPFQLSVSSSYFPLKTFFFRCGDRRRTGTCRRCHV